LYIKFIRVRIWIFLGGSLWTENEIKGKVLHKLTRMGKFKHSHTSIDNLPKGFPKELRGFVKSCVKELINEAIFFLKPTSYGQEISINLDKKDKILYYIDSFLKKD
jgi:hypothetical protein